MTDWHITVNWASEDAELDANLAEMRMSNPYVTFERDPDWVPGPGSDQWPRVRIASGSLPAVQAAIREFGIGPLDDLTTCVENWKYDAQSGRIEYAGFDWSTKDGAHRAIGTEIINVT